MGSAFTSDLETPVRPLRRSEYDRLVASGVFDAERLELIHGALVPMSPTLPPHSATVQRLNRMLVTATLGRADVRIQSPFAASDESEPEPDLALVEPGDYDEDHPSRAFLLIEVSDSTIRQDRRVKGALYAACGVPEFWIVNLRARTIEVHRAPEGDRYATAFAAQFEDEVAIEAFPDVTLRVSDILR